MERDRFLFSRVATDKAAFFFQTKVGARGSLVPAQGLLEALKPLSVEREAVRGFIRETLASISLIEPEMAKASTAILEGASSQAQCSKARPKDLAVKIQED